MAGDGKKLIRNTAAEFLIFAGQASGQGVEARPEDESVWLPQKLMAELVREATLRKFRRVQTAGNTEVSCNVNFYNLDAIISVGYRINYVRATECRSGRLACCVGSRPRFSSPGCRTSCISPSMATLPRSLSCGAKGVCLGLQALLIRAPCLRRAQ